MTVGGERRALAMGIAALVLTAACGACAASETQPGGADDPAGPVTSAVPVPIVGGAGAGEDESGGQSARSVPAPTDAVPSTQPVAADGAGSQTAVASTTTVADGTSEGDESATDRSAARQRRRDLVRPRAGSETAMPGPAPQWPFEGLVQLAWGRIDEGSHLLYPPEGWYLRFYQWRSDPGRHPYWLVSQVELSGLSVECVGKTGLVVDGDDGLLVGGLLGAVSGSYRVPWGGTAVPLDAPPEMLLDEVQQRPSNVAVETAGDHARLGDAEHAVRFALREPARSDGTWWDAQARHDGDVAVVFVHPARHECFSGITWLIAAHSGDLLACGADTAATKWVSFDLAPETDLVLPEAGSLPDYLSCSFPLDPGVLWQGPPQ